MGGAAGTGGTGVLLELLELQTARETSARGRRGGIPSPRVAAHRLSGDDTALLLPGSGPAAVAGPPAPAAGGAEPDRGEHAHQPSGSHLSAQPGGSDGSEPAGHLAARRPSRRAARRAARAGGAPADGPSRAAVLVAVAGLGLVAACWSGASALLADRVPDGTTVAGAAIGGLDRDDAVRVVAQALEPRLATPLPVVLAAAPTPAGTAAGTAAPSAAPSAAAAVDPGAADLELDAAATVSRAIGPVGLPTTLWHQLRGRGEVDPVVEADPAKLAAAVARAAVALDVPAVEGAISFATGQPVAVQPVPGVAVDRAAAADLVLRSWLAPEGTAAGQRPVALPQRPVVPEVGADAVADALQARARPALSAPLTVVVGGRSVVLAPAQVAPALSLVPADGGLQLQVDGAGLAAAVVAADPAAAVAAQDARLDTSSGTPVVVPSADGSEPDAGPLAEAAARALVATGAAREVIAPSRPVPPALTTEALTAMGVTTLLGQVVSPLTADPVRSADVALAARALDGALVAPGDSLDVGARIGAPTPEAGYQPATVVVEGRATATPAAGSTQVASALHAAAVAAGLRVDSRTAPASWNPRDPVGLDAVVGPDDPLVVGEAGPSGALVRAEVLDGALRVQVWGGAGRTVSLETSPPSDPRPALQVVDGSPECVPQAGQDGFTTTVVRTTTAQGAEPATDEVTTTYAPRTAVTCSAAPVPAVPLAID